MAAGALIQAAQRAIAVVFSPSSTNEERHRAHEVLEEIKKSDADLEHIGFELAQCNDSYWKFGGLQFIEHGICTHWSTAYCNNLVPKVCKYWKETLKREGEPKLVLIQVSKVLVELAKRLWPQCWKSFIDDVIMSFQIGKCQLLVGLLALRGLGDDLLAQEQKVKDKDRKKQLMAGLRKNIGRVADFFRHILQFAEDIEVLKTTLEAVLPFFGWMPIGDVFRGEPGKDITDCLLKMLTNTQLRMDAAECLLALAMRKDSLSHEKEMREKTIGWFFSNFSTLVVIIKQANGVLGTSGDILDLEEYQFLKLMSQVTMEMGTILLLPYWKSQGHPIFPVNFSNYLELMLSWLTYDSQVVSTSSCDFWKAVFDDFSDFEPVSRCIPHILDVFHKTLSKIESRFNEYDFNDVAESTSYSSVYKNVHVNLLRQLMVTVPDVCKDHLFLWTDRLISRSCEVGQVGPEECSANDPIVLEWNAYLSYLETWTKCLRLPVEKVPQGIGEGSVLLKALLQFESHHGWVTWCILKSWCVLHSFAIHDPSVMKDILFKLSQYVVYCPIGEEMHKFSKSTLHVRRTALSGLSKLCGSFPLELSREGLAEQVLQLYNDLLTGNKIRMGEKSGFVECLALLSHCLPDTSKWQEVLQSILGSERAVLDSVQQQDALVNAESFLKYLHLDKEPSHPMYSEGRLKRAQLSAAVGCYTAVLKGFTQITKMLPNDPELSPLLQQRGSIIFKSIASDLTVFVLRLIKCLYEVWSPRATPHLSLTLKNLSEKYHSFEIETIMGSVVLHPDLKEIGEEVDFVRLWLSNLYEHSVMFVENVMCSCPEFFATPLAPQHVAQCVFVESMDPLRQKTALRHILLSGVNACPPSHYGNLVPFVLISFALALKVLDQRWSHITLTRAQRLPDEESRSPDGEILFYHLTVFLGKEYLKCLDIALLKTVEAAESSKISDSVEMVDVVEEQPLGVGAHMSTLGLGGVQLSELACFLWEQGHADCIIEWAFSPLVWLDSQHVAKAAKMAAAVYSKLLTSEVFDWNLSAKLFRQILQSINIYGEQNAKITANLAYYVYSTNVKIDLVKSELLHTQCTDQAEIKELDSFILQGKVKQARDLFKRIAARIQEVPLSERYKREAFIPKLPEGKPKRRKPALPGTNDAVLESTNSQGSDILGLASLFGD